MNLKDKTNTELLHMLLEVTNELGWVVAIPETEDDDDVPGLVIGKPEYVEHVMDCVELADDGDFNTTSH